MAVGDQAKASQRVYLVVRHGTDASKRGRAWNTNPKNVRYYPSLVGVRAFMRTAAPDQFEVYYADVEWKEWNDGYNS